MKAFVAGGTGFLGTHLVQNLDKQGWDIVALHRPSSDLSELKKCSRVSLVPGDILDIESLRSGMPEGVNAVFHCAGSVGNLPHSQEGSRYRINQEGTQNVVKICQEKNIGRLIYTSTVLTYDYKACQPLTESAPANLWSKDAYIYSKRLADEEVAKAAQAGLDVVFLHPSALFGAYDKDTWSKMFREVKRGIPLPASPPGAMSVCHALPVAKAHISAFEKGKSGQHYLLGGPDVTILEVLQVISQILQKRPPRIKLPAILFKAYGWTEFLISSLIGREPMLTPHTIDILCQTVFIDSSKAISELGYQSTTLEEMLKDCYDCMLATKRI